MAEIRQDEAKLEESIARSGMMMKAMTLAFIKGTQNLVLLFHR